MTNKNNTVHKIQFWNYSCSSSIEKGLNSKKSRLMCKNRVHVAPIDEGISQMMENIACSGFFSPLSCSASKAIDGKVNKFVKKN